MYCTSTHVSLLHILLKAAAKPEWVAGVIWAQHVAQVLNNDVPEIINSSISLCHPTAGYSGMIQAYDTCNDDHSLYAQKRFNILGFKRLPFISHASRHKLLCCFKDFTIVSQLCFLLSYNGCHASHTNI